MSELNILFLDDKDFITQNEVAKHLSQRWKVEIVSSYLESFTLLRKRHFDVLLLDHDLGTHSPTGIQLIPRYLKEFPQLVIIMITNNDDLQEMKQALLIGAEDYIIKSPSICEDVFLKIPECINRAINKKIITTYREDLKSEDPLFLLGTSPSVKTLRESIKNEKSKESHLVLIGETGSGRSSLARYFWKIKDDPARPFILFKLAKIPKVRLETDLFGKYGGKQGAFLCSHFGDLLITDFDHASKKLKEKIIETINSKIIQIKNSTTTISIKNRLILTSNSTLKLTKKSKLFRHIFIPPLRERREDIPVIVSEHLNRYQLNKYFLSENACNFLQSQQWPGNLKQLIQLIDLVIADLKTNKREKIDTPDLIRAERKNSLNRDGMKISLPNDKATLISSGLENFMASCERSMLIHSLSIFDGNISEASHALGISISTFYRKLERLNLTLEKAKGVKQCASMQTAL